MRLRPVVYLFGRGESRDFRGQTCRAGFPRRDPLDLLRQNEEQSLELVKRKIGKEHPVANVFAEGRFQMSDALVAGFLAWQAGMPREVIWQSVVVHHGSDGLHSCIVQ